MYVEKLTAKMLEEKYPNANIKFNGSDSPDFTITHLDGSKRYVEVKTIGRREGKLQLKVRQFDKLRGLPNCWLWVFDCYDKLICEALIGIIVPNETKQINGLKIVWHNPKVIGKKRR